MFGFGKSTFRNRRNQQQGSQPVTQYNDALDYEWVLAPEVPADTLTDTNGMVLALNDQVQHVDNGSYGTIKKIDFSPYFGEESILMALVVWDTPDSTIDVDYYAGWVLSLA